MQARSSVFISRKGSAAEEMILQIISGRADNIRTTVALYAESYGINCHFVQCLDIFSFSRPHSAPAVFFLYKH